MITYLLIVLSFSMSNLWFIHIKGLRKEGIKHHPIILDVFFVLLMTLSFPLVLPGWLLNYEAFSKAYRKSVATYIRKENI